jgi:AcrR family transcriptional regulator
VTESADLVNKSEARMDRVLDAAGELLLRWGYQRVTIDEIARHAGIGKGTVYLHFPNKEALFLTLLLRAQRRSLTGVLDAVAADPRNALPSRVLRHVYLHVAADPVLRALYLGDAEVLGRLTHEATETLGELSAERARGVREHFAALREAGAMRTDLDLDAQVHVMQAVATGFFFVDALPASPLDTQQRADLIAHTTAGALEVADPPREALADVVDRLGALYTSMIDKFDEELRRRTR